MWMSEQQILELLKNATCEDIFACPFEMVKRTKGGGYYCSAIYPQGDENEPKQYCVFHQAASLIERLIKERDEKT